MQVVVRPGKSGPGRGGWRDRWRAGSPVRQGWGRVEFGDREALERLAREALAAADAIDDPVGGYAEWIPDAEARTAARRTARQLRAIARAAGFLDDF